MLNNRIYIPSALSLVNRMFVNCVRIYFVTLWAQSLLQVTTEGSISKSGSNLQLSYCNARFDIRTNRFRW